MYFKKLIFAVLLCGMAAPAFSQDFDVSGRRRPGEDGTVRIQSSLSISVPVKEGDDMAIQQETALRSFYKLVAGSCAMVIETIADSCEITNVTTNVNSKDRGVNGPQIGVTGQITMKVKFKASLSKTAP
ncbi:hypothetical protein LHFGNBLO_003260 [Mesorhizobium sp. AR10]|uniref:hypothetical protein n=1 Tax=Mesorhizobium sp. AR10 TaxID=2865839 RepID=UPI00215FFFE5|nr:hypothetical protein [Mesorhizobium sp. AR10]UVK36349.1 hypothetical protein LHFGNBLO_003260 [Mesorhizobium sp. AR10]